MIPNEACAVFPICLSHSEEKGFSHRVEYVVNGFHFFDVAVEAEVLAPRLDPSSAQLVLSLPLDSWLPTADHLLALHNPTKAEAQFSWDNSCPGTFTVTPLSGKVSPRSSGEAHVRWAPRLNDKKGATTRRQRGC